jgi:hypothetical protein
MMLAAGLMAASCQSQGAGQSPTRDIGSQVQLFCDNWLIDSLTGARLVMHSPCPREVVFTFDAPWEGGIGSYATLIKDGRKYRLYYQGGGETAREHTCLALSTDGIHFTRPSLGLFEYNGSKDNNIVWTGKDAAYCESHNFSPFIDTNPDCKMGERYKAVALKSGVPPGESDRRKVLVGFVSPDGINWKRIQEQPIITDGSFDSHNTASWDPERREYVCYLRIGREGKRSVALTTSKDFLHWTESQPLDFGATPLEHFYTNGIEPYLRNPSLYVGFPMRFVSPKDRDKVGFEQRRTDGFSDMVFMSSHDGLHWNRQFMEAFVRPGLDQLNWGGAHGNQTPVWHIQQTGDSEMSIYWFEHSGYYNMWLPEGLKQRPREKGKEVDARLRRGTLRLDGFASVNAPYAGGEMVTKPLKFEGKKLVMNFSTSAVGSVRVEIQDASGKPIPGYALDDCPEIWGDEIDRVVGWKNGPDLGKLTGTPVRLRFVLKDADLYSIRCQP